MTKRVLIAQKSCLPHLLKTSGEIARKVDTKDFGYSFFVVLEQDYSKKTSGVKTQTLVKTYLCVRQY